VPGDYEVAPDEPGGREQRKEEQLQRRHSPEDVEHFSDRRLLRIGHLFAV
jgi:hypothetical protein